MTMKLITSLLFLLVLPMASSAPKCEFTVMTRNLYYGSGLDGLLDATPEEFMDLLYYYDGQASGSNFELRMKAVAQEICDNKPVIVGLQEAATWTNLDPATYEQINFVELILYWLENLKDPKNMPCTPYDAVISADPVFSFALPPYPFSDLTYHSLSWGDVLLVSQDVLGQIETSTTATYAEYVTDYINLPWVEDPLPLEQPRSWVSVDATLCGRKIRVLSTHLESFDQEIRTSQAIELVVDPESPLNTDLPIILMGDLNSEVDVDGDAVDVLLNGGNNIDSLNDAWEDAGIGGDGITYLFDFDLMGVSDGPPMRIDYILSSDELEPKKCKVLDTDIDPSPDDRPLRPSDHNAVVATFVVQDDDDQGEDGDDQGQDGN